ncbi:MAG: GDP-mannose 4,6-dehydratase [Eubacteriales bacterium]
MSTILITGGAGFIGSHLAKSISQKNKVIIVDNFNDYYNPLIKEMNINDIKKTRDASIYRIDIRDKINLSKVFENHKINIVIHLAAMAGVRPSIESPNIYSEVNINGTMNVLELCRENNVSKMIFASSSSVYGNNKKTPFSENDIVDFPISPYAATKKAGELLCHTYHHLYNIDIACLRFFTVYGPGQRPDLAIHKFTKLLYNNEPIPFYGDGKSERDYTYIDDIIDGINKAVNWLFDGKGKYEIFNLGESHTISLQRMVSTIEKVTGIKPILKKLPMQPGDVNITYADITKAKKIIGYNPQTDFEEGITNFIKWYKICQS